MQQCEPVVACTTMPTFNGIALQIKYEMSYVCHETDGGELSEGNAHIVCHQELITNLSALCLPQNKHTLHPQGQPLQLQMKSPLPFIYMDHILTVSFCIKSLVFPIIIKLWNKLWNTMASLFGRVEWARLLRCMPCQNVNKKTEHLSEWNRTYEGSRLKAGPW